MTATDQSTTPITDGVTLTEGAASKVKALLDGEGRDDLALRIAVQPGGCSGFATSCSSTSGAWTATSSPSTAA